MKVFDFVIKSHDNLGLARVLRKFLIGTSLKGVLGCVRMIGEVSFMLDWDLGLWSKKCNV